MNELGSESRKLGTAAHAASISQGRHPGVVSALAWLAFSHLPPKLQDYSRPFYQTAVELIMTVREDSAELTTALNRLVEAKDWAVRAGIRGDQGKPGPVPRPATVVDPPTFGRAKVPARPDQLLPPASKRPCTCDALENGGGHSLTCKYWEEKTDGR